MTLERAKQLVVEHGCHLGNGGSSSLVVINEAINFQYTLFLKDLPAIAEDAFVSTITTGRVRRGQQPLPGFYQDYQSPPVW